MADQKANQRTDQKRSVVSQFKEFILRGNVVDLAIAVVIGGAFNELVKSFVADLITPLVSIFSKNTNFADLAIHVRGARFAYGAFLNSAVTFVIVAAVVFFFVVKPINFVMERRRRALAGGDADDAPSVPDEIALLTEIRDLLASGAGPARPAAGRT